MQRCVLLRDTANRSKGIDIGTYNGHTHIVRWEEGTIEPWQPLIPARIMREICKSQFDPTNRYILWWWQRKRNSSDYKPNEFYDRAVTWMIQTQVAKMIIQMDTDRLYWWKLLWSYRIKVAWRALKEFFSNE